MTRKLMEFIVKMGKEENESHFIAYGEFSTEVSKYKMESLSGEPLIINGSESFIKPVFDDVSLKMVVDGKEVDWKPSKRSSCDAYDAVAEMVQRITMNNTRIRVIFLDQEIQSYVEQYKNKNAFVNNGRNIPLFIYYSAYDVAVSLNYATDKYLYYGDEDLIMVNIDDGEIMAEGGFAENCFYDSLAHVKSGEEKLLFSNLPDDYEIE